MNLKSIDIYGFKSFAEPIHLRFDQPVSIIVGPNRAERVILPMQSGGH